MCIGTIPKKRDFSFEGVPNRCHLTTHSFLAKLRMYALEAGHQARHALAYGSRRLRSDTL